MALHSISYSPVGLRRPKEDYWARCVPGDRLDPIVRARFEHYVRRCYEGDHANFQEVTFETEDGKFLRRKLREMSQLSLTKENRDRRALTQELSDALCKKMENSGQGVPGAIFVLQATVDEKPYMVIVKLDFGHRVIVALQETKPDSDLFGQEFERALSEEAKRIRKGVIVPSPREGDAFSVQFDSSAEYWRLFVGAEPIRPSLNASKNVMAVTEQVLQEENKPLTAKMAFDIVEGANKIVKPSAKELAEVVREATGLQKSTKALTERFDASMDAQTIPGMLPVKSIRYSFGHGLYWIVDAQWVKKGVVEVRQKGSDVHITIHDATLSEKPVFDDK